MGEAEAAAEELPLETVGTRLARAREAAGMSLTQIAGVTRIPERHLAAIEAGNYAALPARTYATGFTRSYAKALGLEAEAYVRDVRAELAEQQPDEPRRQTQTFEPGDPARVPGARLAWLAAGGIVLVLIAGFILARPMFAPGMTLPSILKDEAPAPAPAPAAASPAAPVGGPVVFTALEPKVWVKFTDGAGNQLFQKELAQGESWTVPADQADVRIQTARPDALAITIGGQGVAKLSDSQQTIRDVPVTAAALLARTAATPAPVATASTPAATRSAAPIRRSERREAASGPAGTAAPPAAPTAFPTEPVAAAPVPAPVPQPSAT